MRYSSKFFIMVAVLAAAAACDKSDDPAPVDPVIDYGKFKFSSVFTPRDSKTGWNESEQIAISWIKEDNTIGSAIAKASAAGSSAEFTASVDSTGYYYAFYPASDNVELTAEDMFSVTVPASQGGYLTRTGLSIAKTEKNKSELVFESVLPTVKFKVVRDDVTSVYLRGVKGEPLAGKVQLKLENGKYIFGSATDTTGEIEVTVDGAGTYYAAILPDVAFKDGLMIRYGRSGEYLPAVVVKPEKLAADIIADFGAINPVTTVEINSEADLELFRTMTWTESTISEGKAVYDSVSVVGQGWLSNGVTFKFGNGTFDLAGADAAEGDAIDMEYWYYGDTYKSPVVIRIEGNGTDNTVFTGNVNDAVTSGHGILKVQDYCNLYLKNLALKDTRRPGNQKGGALMVASKTMCKAEIDGCLFENNNVPEDGGGAIGLVDGPTLVVRNSVFRNNTAKNGGVLYGTITSDITIDDCVFEANKGTGTNGPSVAMFWGEAFARFNNCLFKDNRASDRAVVNSQGNSVVLFNACTFERNSNTQAGKYASALHAGGNFMGINNCTFYQNNVKDGTAPQNNSESLSANADMLITNSTFYEYFQANRGVIAGLAAGKSAGIFNNIILNTYSGCAFYFSSGGYMINSCGHNIYRNVTDYRTGSAKIGLPAEVGDIPGVAANILSNASYDEVNHIYKWAGTLISGELVPATPAEFESAVKSYQTVLTNRQLDGKKAGDIFWEWLVSIKATDVDQTGAKRGSSWWPGSYQFN